MKNKKGFAPMAYLFFGTFILVTAALFSMASFNGKVLEDTSNSNILIREIEIYESSIITGVNALYLDAIKDDKMEIRQSIQDLASKRQISAREFGNIFGKLRNGDFTVREGLKQLGNSERVEYTNIIEIRDIFIEANSKGTSIRREFDLILEFDKFGNILSVKKQNKIPN